MIIQKLQIFPSKMCIFTEGCKYLLLKFSDNLDPIANKILGKIVGKIITHSLKIRIRSKEVFRLVEAHAVMFVKRGGMILGGRNGQGAGKRDAMQRGGDIPCTSGGT